MRPAASNKKASGSSVHMIVKRPGTSTFKSCVGTGEERVHVWRGASSSKFERVQAAGECVRVHGQESVRGT